MKKYTNILTAFILSGLLHFQFTFFCFSQAKQTSKKNNLPFKGIYVATKWHHPVEEYVLKSSDVDGVHLRLRWNALQPEKNKFDWSYLDAELKRIVAAGKKISFGVAAGKHTPDWVYAAGVPGLEFTEFRKQGKSKKFDVKVPVPWDTLFLDYWTAFIKSFAQHLKSMPDVYENITLIKLTGINETTLELRLPAQQNIENERGKSTDAPAIWKKAGYRPGLVMKAWQEILNSFQASFGDKHVSIEIIPDKAFPALDDSGNDAENIFVQDFTERMIAAAHKKFNDKLVLQWDALRKNGNIPKFMVTCSKYHTPVGYQIAESEYVNPECLKTKTLCDEVMFKSIFEKARLGDGIFIEIFQKDVIAFPKALTYGKEIFWK